ncbi:tRNA-dihydrouridine synthase [Ottowia sp.]|uniref:tRNA-dihydrouridine synthase n=1 Tax=Ottowia sp. TaxID=1898956 RepID=UPI002C339481|nr:tRNA-dihydrouridine synthase [Ottowia sp.]HRN75464.1 tRNA-dihydrouridine synthase [Ottowia sp.]HRQ02579.1 tRNA-dihydrouridine synthase [Ottowia sp.]
MSLRIVLAPMEGLLDHGLRAILTRVGGVDRCVSEFIRITDRLLPARSFIRVVPELLSDSRTAAGVPVRPQLLGSDPVCLAENAARLAELRPAGIDLNFGCPARTVNRHRGGAVLLDEPELIHAIVTAVRRAVPAHIAVSAKMRLGYDDDTRMLDCARAIAAAGASELAVHARTKAHGYRPPAYWESIALIRQQLPLPVIANGEIWSVQDAARCREVTGCDALMLGRGMVRRPGLALAIADAARAAAQGPHEPVASYSDAAIAALPWRRVVPLLTDFWTDVTARVERRHRAGRLKQWLNYLRAAYPEAQQAFDVLRAVNDPQAVGTWVQRTQAQYARLDLPVTARAAA